MHTKVDVRAGYVLYRALVPLCEWATTQLVRVYLQIALQDTSAEGLHFSAACCKYEESSDWMHTTW